MPTKRRRSYVWQVEYPNGEVCILNRLSSARITLTSQPNGGNKRVLQRAGKGSYYFVERYDTPAGPRVQMVRVHRVPAKRGAQELENARFDFDAPASSAPASGSNDGV